MRYAVRLSGVAIVRTTVRIKADSPEAASKAAIEQANHGDVVWKYDGLSEDEDPNVQADEVTEDP